jgi:DMSO/TMAO reductase YedYZ molybdopterin-dependent catalytic subunit
MNNTRREILRGSVAIAGLGVLSLPEWAMPVLAQGETQIPFTDMPANANFAPAADRRVVDLRKIDGPFTSRDQFYTIQHYNQPEIDPATYRLNISGLVDRATSLSLDDLRRMKASELVAGFECSGNRRPLQGLCGNGRWTGVPLRTVLDRAGVKSQAREFVFFGTDRGDEDVEFRTNTYKVQQQFGRSLSRDHALSGEPFLAYAMNGEPLTKNQGFPVRLIVPGWYGVSNVKWLSQIHVQDEAYLGKFQARWYRTLRGETINGEMKWTETAISRMRLKSFIARVTKDGSGHKVLGVVLHDGTPIKSVEVKVDEGAWQPATLDGATSSKYSWKLFNYAWAGATPGEHTIVSRVTDVTGRVQPTVEALENKKTFLEDNSQFPRKVMVS